MRSKKKDSNFNFSCLRLLVLDSKVTHVPNKPCYWEAAFAQGAFLRKILLVSVMTFVIANPMSVAVKPAKEAHGLVLAQSQNAESFYKQGIAKLQRKDYRGAGADFNEALRLKPNYAEAYYGRGRVRYFLDNDRGAILDFNEAIRLKPNYAEAYYGRALAHRYVKAYKASSDDFLTALRLNPGYAKQPDIWSNFGQLLLDVGENKQALDHFNEALRLQSNHADALYGRAIARYKLNGDLSAFISELEKAARLYREQGNTQSFSETVAEINRARAHLNQQNVRRRYQCRQFDFDYTIETLTEAEASRRRECVRL